MKQLRQIHLYLGCVFAPLLIYFALSGLWQLYRLNDIPKGETPTAIQSLLHDASNPHTHSAFPGKNPRESHSQIFDIYSTFMALGIVLTTLIGVFLALRFARNAVLVWGCLILGTALPIVTLLLVH